MPLIYLIVPFAPLVGALVAGLLGWAIGRRLSHWVATASVAVSLVVSWFVFQDVLAGHTYNVTLYTWMHVGGVDFSLGFLIDPLSALMMLVVCFVSLMVHVYTIGYMADDPGYSRFFSYISLFTFAMLMLVMSNNFLQLFFGWEAVGLVSYLLIGFWYTRPTAVYANLKAFLANRVGDFGFLLGIAMVLAYFGSLDYATVFQRAAAYTQVTLSLFPGHPWSLLSVICLLLFVGAMGKSAQMPLHVWLPDSMEGPTPISALIHAATMVTAGIFMVARMSPLFELSDTALATVMVVGGVTALFMGLLGIVQNDIKRVVAYSTLSQLGYMTAALGASAYSVAIFHLMTHAFFKALLFLAAGSVIIALHHEQDIRKMGGLYKYMPITWSTFLIGSLALIGTPFLSGFYSKDSILEAVHASNLAAAQWVYPMLEGGVFITAFYTFRLYFLVFHGRERFHDVLHGHLPQESPWVVTIPLLALAAPSLAIGYMTIGPLLYGSYFGTSLYVADRHPALADMAQNFPGAVAMALHSLATPVFWLSAAGVALAWWLYVARTDLPERISRRLSWLYALLVSKYGFDEFNDWFFARGARLVGGGLWRRGDVMVIDNWMVNGAARAVGAMSRLLRHIQTGYIYHYALAMLVGAFALVTLFTRLAG